MPWFAAAAPIIGAVVGIAGTGISLIAGMGAAQQQAANASAMANYNAQIQQQNAQVAYQMQTYQAQQNAAMASANIAMAQQNQQIAMGRAALAANNQQIALTQAAAARAQYQAGLDNAKATEDYAKVIRAQGREEARRMREESEQRQAAMRAKYAGTGVTFEGSPLVVLADAARLAETSVQDTAYITDIEQRRQLRAGEIERFRAGFSLIDAYQFEGQAFSEGINRQNALVGDLFGAQVQEVNYKNQLQGFKYDSLVAGAKRSIALNQAELTRFGGAVQSSNIESQATGSLISGLGSMATTAIGGFQRASTSGLFGPRYPSTLPFSQPSYSGGLYRGIT